MSEEDYVIKGIYIGHLEFWGFPFHEVKSPIDGKKIAHMECVEDSIDMPVKYLHDSFLKWRNVPAPQRGEYVRRIGNKFREEKERLAGIICVETGKTMQESLGEVQECIDICDFAVGLSRQLHGLTIASERPNHQLLEKWQPLGVVGVISAFNFPMAVWMWNTALALVCGNTVLWKPSEKAPRCALKCHLITVEVLKEFPDFPEDLYLCGIVNGKRRAGELVAEHKKIALVSATGSVAMGRKVGEVVAKRLGKSLLELGGNNGLIVSKHANIELALRAIVFSAVGTTGQRCTSLRRLFIYKSIRVSLIEQIKKAYETITIGDPSKDVLMGPLIDMAAYEDMQNTLAVLRNIDGVEVFGGEKITKGVPKGGWYVTPAIVVGASHSLDIVQQETFAPILYTFPYRDLDDVIEIHNSVPQGLSSAIFTDNIQEAEKFISASGSDCGIANINIGTSGAEIGGAFGGEKDTGGGRESGSDSWKQYMRRQTITINYGKDLPLAQGIKFDV
jgi:aldehyde dehydrogenase (NAD+)